MIPKMLAATALLIVVSTASLLCGATFYSIDELLSDPHIAEVVWKLRLPRVLLAIVVGGGLAVVGGMYQSLFRNHLASPFSLGVSSGAALGASLAVVWGLPSFLGGNDVCLAAMLGALLSIAAISTLSRREKSGDRLLLVGIVFSFLCSSALTLVQYLADYSQLFKVTRWLMGGVPTATNTDVVVGLIFVLSLLLFTHRESRSYDLLLFGDDVARTKGVDVERVRSLTFILSSLFVGWVVAFCGVIGFVGIVVPALARMFVGISHRVLLPFSFLCGALLVVTCDLFGRIVTPPFEVPAGVFTALLGGPFFIGVLLRSSVSGRLFP
jgi:iron complex transport system permease protein